MPLDFAVSPDRISDLNYTSAPHALDLWKRKRPGCLAITSLFNPVKPHPADSAVFALRAATKNDAVIRVYDAVGNVIETHEHKGEFKER
jgi:hypothetical protein